MMKEKPEWNCFPMSVYRYKCPSYNQALARLGSRIRVWSHVSLAGHTGTTGVHGRRIKFSQDRSSSTPLVFQHLWLRLKRKFTRALSTDKSSAGVCVCHHLLLLLLFLSINGGLHLQAHAATYRSLYK